MFQKLCQAYNALVRDCWLATPYLLHSYLKLAIQSCESYDLNNNVCELGRACAGVSDLDLLRYEDR